MTKALKFFGRSNNKIERKETIKNRHGHFILFSFHRERDLLRMTNMQKKKHSAKPICDLFSFTGFLFSLFSRC